MSDDLTPEQEQYVEDLRNQILEILKKVREEEGVDVPVDVSVQQKEEDNE